jgi:UDP-N-acetylmuramate: L-alanyl-gamma-D-glutamyl-meso-diaminopimelate ligase
MTAFPYRKVHFIGIAGVGMSATALLLRGSGVAVTGSDEAVYPPISDVLAAEKLDFRTPYAAANIPPDAEAVVIGKNARLVPETNAEVAAAVASGRPILSFAQVLGLLSEGRETVVIAGSFGKSTSTTMLAHLLDVAGLDPSFMIGAVPLSPPTSARIGKGPFLLEGDEYPSSNTDDRSKFLHYHPSHLLVTPLAHDHVNVFPTIEDYLGPFFEIAAMTPADGLTVVSTGGELSTRFLDGLTRPVVTYGIDSGDWQAADIVWGERTAFTVTRHGQAVVRVETGQLGLHNVENIVGVAAFAFSRGLVEADVFRGAMASFRGIKRRLDRKSMRTSIPIFEGFGSSYDKARSAIAAMKLHFPGRRLICVFEPHTFSWRNRAALHWYDDVFEDCAKVFIYEPASQGAGTHAQVSLDEIVTRVRAAGCDVTAVGTREDGIAAIGDTLSPGDAVLLLTSGNLGGLIEAVPQWAEEHFPA